MRNPEAYYEIDFKSFLLPMISVGAFPDFPPMDKSCRKPNTARSLFLGTNTNRLTYPGVLLPGSKNGA